MNQLDVLTQGRKSNLLLASVAIAVLLACGLAILGAARPAEAKAVLRDGKIAFNSLAVGSVPGQTASREIQTMDPDGSDRSGFTPHVDGYSPAWSPDGRRLAFMEALGRLVVMNADGTGRAYVPNADEAWSNPAWSPDGTRLAYWGRTAVVDANDPMNEQEYSDIFTINLDGTGKTNVTHNAPPQGTGDLSPATHGFEDPTWSPDGSKIAFTRFAPDGQRILIANADGSGQPRDLPNPANGRDPAWSPDGTKIAFVGPDKDLYVMNQDGSGQRKVTTDGQTVVEGYPAWSPGGTKLAFQGQWNPSPCLPSCPQVEIFTIDVDGTDRADVTQTTDRQERFPTWQPEFAPNVDAVSPANGLSGVSRRANLRATFSEQMDPASITKATFQLYRCPSATSIDCTTQVTRGTVGTSSDGLRATLNPYGRSSTRLAPRTKYKAVITTGAKDMARNALDQDSSSPGDQPQVWYFTTGRT